MKLNSHCDNHKLFEKYLNGSLEPELSVELETHLSGCEHCRVLLEHHSAEPDVWENLRSLLGDVSNSAVAIPTSSTAGPVQPVTQSVVESLAPTDDPEMLGRLGEYEISGVVGIGGMGAVLRGFDKSLRRVVAIKVMASHLAGSGPARERFQREARAAAAITHDNVIDIYGVSQANGLPYLVMPYARGPSLQKRIDDSGPLTAVEAVRIGRQIASGLSAAHEQGLVHRDIKPANILLNEGIERLWITDFGVARAIDDASMTNTGVIAGTPQYMSPEQARGETVDHRSDLFSLGSVLYTACTGRPPFRSETAYGVLRRITDFDPRPIREINPDIPPWLCRIIRRLIAKHPADRFESASEVAELFERCLAHLQQPTLVELPASVVVTESSNATSRHLARSEAVQASARRSVVLRPSFLRPGVLAVVASLFLAAVGLVAFELTNPASVEGRWVGEDWREVRLSTTSEAPGWYTGEFTDADGRRGVLHLEWSRMQRRFNGRWQIGADASGPITLRSHSDDEMRGAVSFDVDARSAPDLPRLRDFTWSRNETSDGASNHRLGDQATPKRTVRIASPIKGVVGKTIEGIKVGTKVSKGQVLVELRPVDGLPNDDVLKASRDRLLGAQELLQAKEREFEISQRGLDLAKRKVDATKQERELVDEAGLALLRALDQKLEAARKKIEQNEAELAAATKAVQVADRARSKGLLSANEFSQLKAKQGKASVQLDESRANLKSILNERSANETERAVKVEQAKSRMDDATADMIAADAVVARANTSLILARLEVRTAERENTELERRANELQRLIVRSPIDGTIVSVGFTAAMTIFEGNTLFSIVPDDLKDVPTQ